jgi:hypothetical protein
MLFVEYSLGAHISEANVEYVLGAVDAVLVV